MSATLGEGCRDRPIGAAEVALSGVPDRVPLSIGQQALWLFQYMSPRSCAYHVPLAFRLAGPVDVGLLRAALDVVTRRHEALRTAFRQDTEGTPYQIVLPWTPTDLPVYHATDDEAVATIVNDAARAPFDLAEGRPIRAVLIRLDRHDHVFVVVTHHIVSDGWSMRLLTQEISTAYRAMAGGEQPDAALPRLEVQYADYALWQREWWSGPELDSRLAYWQRTAEGLRGVDLTDGRARPRRPTYAADRLIVEVPRWVTDPLRAHTAATGASFFALLATAFTLLLRERTGEPDIAFGTMLAGRTEPELEHLVGYFVNLVMLRCDLRDDPTPAVVAKRLGTAMLAAIDHEAPFPAVVERLAPRRVAGRNPLFQITMQLRTGGSAPAPLRLPGVTVTEVDVYPGQHAFDLTVSFLDTPPALRISVEYTTEAFDRLWAADFADQLIRILHALSKGTSDDRAH